MPAMVANTRWLFIRLLSRLQITAICDVGSMDGADTLAFHKAVPDSSIYAFEPNPKNYRLMQSDGRLRARNIELVPMAASNYDGDADFFIVAAADSFEARLRRGMSSLYRRPNDWDVIESVLRVKTTRLDTFLNHKASGERRIALWIDAEGKAYEVIEGMTGILKNIHLIHVEVETTCSIGANQRLYSNVPASPAAARVCGVSVGRQTWRAAIQCPVCSSRPSQRERFRTPGMALLGTITPRSWPLCREKPSYPLVLDRLAEVRFLRIGSDNRGTLVAGWGSHDDGQTQFPRRIRRVDAGYGQRCAVPGSQKSCGSPVVSC